MKALSLYFFMVGYKEREPSWLGDKGENMNRTEKFSKHKYESLGYDVIKNGQPDFILLKDGKISFREIKGKGQSLSEKQERAFKLLVENGFDVKIERVIFTDTCVPSWNEEKYDLENRSKRETKIAELEQIKRILVIQNEKQARTIRRLRTRTA